MRTISILQAHNNLEQLLSDVNTSSEPILLGNDRGKNAVLVSEKDWYTLQKSISK